MRLHVEGPLEDITEFREQLGELETDSVLEVGTVAEKRPDLFEYPSLRFDPLMEFFIAFSAQLSASATEKSARKIMAKAKHWPRIRIKVSVEKPQDKQLEDKSTGNQNQ
jgi:hypothetical protein